MKKYLLFISLLFLSISSFATISWMGNKSVSAQPNDSQTINFYVEMWDSYGGCHAEVFINEGGSWVNYTLTQGADNGSNSTWSANINVKSNSTEYYFHGWDDWGANVYDSNSSSNYSISINPTTKSGGNGNWDDISNWCDGSVPSSTTATYIIAHDLALNQNTTVGALTINASVTFEINPTQQLTVTGSITNNSNSSGVTVKSDVTGNGSLIFSGTGPEAVVWRYIEGYTPSSGDGWHLISSPVDSYSIASSDFEPGANDDFYKFDEATYMWLNQKEVANSITSFENGKGYLVAYESTGDPKNFFGTLNDSDITFTDLSRGDGEGWHLLGNPFTSALIWNESSGWIGSNFVATAKVWSESGGNYLDIATGEVIPSTNGFFVQATSGTNSITIKEGSRTHNTTNNYKSEVLNKMLIQISNDGNNFSDQCIIGFKQEATEDFDLEFDSHKLYGNEKAPQLSSKIGDEVFSTNYLPELNDSYYFNLEFKAGIDASYSIKFEGIESFDSDIFLTLVDLKTNTYTDLRNNANYSFSASTSDDVDRFVIHAFKSATGIGDLDNLNLKVYSHSNIVMVQNQTNSEGNIKIFDLSGKKIFENKLGNQALSSYHLNAPSGAYIIHVQTETVTVRETIIIAKN